jgi:protein SCO1/2
LAAIAAALDKLGAKANAITPVFATLDPARDTPKILEHYLAAFGPRFVGLTGTPAAIAKIAHEYRVYYAKHPLPGNTYAIDHSSAIYLLDPQGRFVKAYDAQATPAAIAEDLKAEL